MGRPPDPDSSAGKNARLAMDAHEAMRTFAARRRGISPEEVHLPDLAMDDGPLIDLLTGLRHWADHFAGDFVRADRSARKRYKQEREQETKEGQDRTQ